MLYSLGDVYNMRARAHGHGHGMATTLYKYSSGVASVYLWPSSSHRIPCKSEEPPSSSSSSSSSAPLNGHFLYYSPSLESRQGTARRSVAYDLFRSGSGPLHCMGIGHWALAQDTISTFDLDQHNGQRERESHLLMTTQFVAHPLVTKEITPSQNAIIAIDVFTLYVVSSA